MMASKGEETQRKDESGSVTKENPNPFFWSPEHVYMSSLKLQMVAEHNRYQMKGVLLFLDIHLMDCSISKCSPFISTLVLTFPAVFQIRTLTRPLKQERPNLSGSFPHPFSSPLV